MDKKKGVKSRGSVFSSVTCEQASEDSSFHGNEVPSNTSTRSMVSTADTLLEGMATSSVNGDVFMNSENYVRDHGSLLSLQPWVFRKGNHPRDEEILKVNGECPEKCGYEMDGFMSNTLAQISPLSVTLGRARGRGRSFLRTKRGRRSTVGALPSMENCLIPQLYKNFEIEEFVFNSFSSSTTPGLRPFVVTDGNTIISKSSYGPDVTSESDVDKVKMDTVSGVSPLPGLRTPKRKSRDTRYEKLGSSCIQRSQKLSHHRVLLLHTQGTHTNSLMCWQWRGIHTIWDVMRMQHQWNDSLDRIQIFSIGVSIGIICTILSNKKEIENLNNMLKRSENLVQDLQEELEMKDSLTVKELANEACGHEKPSDTTAGSAGDQVPLSCSPVENDNDNKQPNLPMEESRSQIEAELEIELEKLELSMNISSLNGRMSALDELDPELIADAVHGELKADILPSEDSEDRANNATDSQSSSSNPTHNFNYPVSPRELSVRLHEVIQLRLEERVKELEGALQQTRKQLQSVESERLLSQRAFSSSDMGSSSNLDSPRTAGEIVLPQPFCLNLGGDALDAYDEAYAEFLRVANMEENPPSTTDPKKELGYSSHSSDRSLLWGGMEGLKHCVKGSVWEPNLKSKRSIDAPNVYLMDEDKYNDNDEEDDDDGMEMLIEQILERTRQGSSFVQDAQRMLFMDD